MSYFVFKLPVTAYLCANHYLTKDNAVSIGVKTKNSSVLLTKLEKPGD